MAKYNLDQVDVHMVHTKYRKIKTKLPVPESLIIFQNLFESEPLSVMV
jgi:hypothetical protein